MADSDILWTVTKEDVRASGLHSPFDEDLHGA